MGAQYQQYKVTAKNKTEVKARANELREDARYQHGQSYTGTIAEDNGQVKFHPEAMPYNEAEEYIEGAARKWEATLAVKIKGEKDLWLLGGVYSE